MKQRGVARAFGTALIVSLGASAALMACQRDPVTRAPPAEECTTCPVSPIGTRATGASATDASQDEVSESDAGQGGAAAEQPVATKTLYGQLLEITSPNLTDTAPFSGAGAVVTAAGPGGFEESTATSQGSSYELEGVALDQPLWVLAHPSETVAHLGGLRLIYPSDQDQTFTQGQGARQAQALTLVRRDVLEDLLLNLTEVAALDPRAGHWLLRIEDERGVPLAGVSVVAPTDQLVAYDLGEIFSDISAMTDARGLVLILNLSATEFPGTSAQLTLQDAAGAFEATAQMVSGAVAFTTSVR